jgi:hypothetical protein
MRQAKTGLRGIGKSRDAFGKRSWQGERDATKHRGLVEWLRLKSEMI